MIKQLSITELKAKVQFQTIDTPMCCATCTVFEWGNIYHPGRCFRNRHTSFVVHGPHKKCCLKWKGKK